MNKKIKKIVTTSVISALTITAVGCGSASTKLAKNIDKSMADFVSSINKLDYVDAGTSNQTTSENLGKIVETSNLNTNTQNQTREIKTIGNQIHFLNNNISEAEIENTITTPSEQHNKFQLYVLSDSPYITLSSGDNEVSLDLNVKFSTDKIATTSNEIESKINKLILKRSILMIYVNEIYNGNVTLSNENKLAINAYVNVIKENTSFLNGNRGMVKNQLNLASDLLQSEENDNLVNYYIIKSGEALETRANKIDSTISAIDSIINIIESNLNINSNYYNTNLNLSYTNLFNNSTPSTITEQSTNQEIASTIANTLGIKTNSSTSQTKLNKLSNTNNNEEINRSKNIINPVESKLEKKSDRNNIENSTNRNKRHNRRKLYNNPTTNEIETNQTNNQTISQNNQEKILQQTEGKTTNSNYETNPENINEEQNNTMRADRTTKNRDADLNTRKSNRPLRRANRVPFN